MIEFDIRASADDFQLACKASLGGQGVTALFGPSGAGKSTLLRAIAGLTPAEGVVRVGTQTWLDTANGIDLAVHRRGAGLLFQDSQLFTHLTVERNLRYAMRRARPNGPEYRDVVEAFGIAPLLERGVTSLSGGEARRVAIARTLLANPALLLLDEPLTGLDGLRKAEIMPHLVTLKRNFAIPALLVTHNVDEVSYLAESVVVIDQGAVVAQGPTAEVLERLDVQALTPREEAGAVVVASVVSHDDQMHLTELTLDGQAITMPALPALQPGASVRLRVRSRDVALAMEPVSGLSIRNTLSAAVVEVAEDPSSAFAEVLLDTGSQHLRARITRAARQELGIQAGQAVYALVKSVTFEQSWE